MTIQFVVRLSLVLAVSLACKSRSYGNDGTVCVCTKNHCDYPPQSTRLNSGTYEMITSSMNGSRFARTSGVFSSNSKTTSKNVLHINREKKFQSIFGFGGAFTDSSGINLLSLSNETRDTLMRSYYGDEGIQYSMGRVPIAGTDFSTRGYTYDDVDADFSLSLFSLQVEDYSYKIPFIKEAMNLTNNNLKLFASAWTAPAWMKTNHQLTGIGFLNISMYDVWAEYHIKFFDAYRQNGLNFWGMTTGNEPANGFTTMIRINEMGWIPPMQAQWIADNLGPKIRLNENYSDMKIMIMDDQRVYFPWIPRAIMENTIAKSFIDGSAVHYYTDQYVPADVLSITHFEFPDKFIFASEGCEGSGAQQQVILGSWERAENYLNSIFDDLNNWSTGWMDWNIALNTEGGPTYVGNFVDSPIIVNRTADEFLKQPMFYAMGHFSKYVRPGSVRVKSLYSGTEVKHVVFERPDGAIVTSLFNPTDSEISLTVSDTSEKGNIDITLEKRSVNTLLYWK